jgi:hypothetical protein
MACNYLEIIVGTTDLNNSTGNTLFNDSTLYVDFYDCYGNPTQELFNSVGTFTASTCYDSTSGVTLTIYQNNSSFPIVDSSYSAGLPCSPPTPTPTVTPTITPTITPTQTITPTITPTNAYPCSAGRLPFTGESVTYGSLTISGAVVGDVVTATTANNTCNINIPFDTNILVGFNNNSYTYTLQLDGFFNNLIFAVGSIDSGEPINISTNSPSSELIGLAGCNYSISGNIISPSPSAAHLYVQVSGSSSYDEVVFSGNGASGIILGICTDSLVTPTPTPTETPTVTPTLTPTVTTTETTTPTITPTITETPTVTPTETPTSTPTSSLPSCVDYSLYLGFAGPPSEGYSYTDCYSNPQSGTINNGQTLNFCALPGSVVYSFSVLTALGPCTPVTQTPTETPTPTITPTITETPTQTPTETSTPTVTPTITPTETLTPTITPTPTLTPTLTSTQTPTPTVTQTTATVIQFRDCSNGSNVFRFGGSSFPVISNDEVYYISGGDDFVGCATVEANDGSGPLYTALGVTFTFVDNCAHGLCPRTSERAALLINCRTSEVFYAIVDEDTAFYDAAYQYNGECYSFVEFSGEGGPYLGSPDFKDCPACLAAVITPTPPPTPTITPTVSLTPSVCSETDFSINTTLYPFSNYNGNYEISSNYNGRPSYTAETTTAYIYFFTSVTESYWCLSDTLGGSCVLRGASPCNSICPDISLNYFNTGRLGTPTPTPSNCQIDFVAYFDCDYNPTPTPTASIDCNDTSISVTSVILTPTPTPTKTSCGPKAVQFTITGTPGNNITLTPTPSPTRTPIPFNVNLGGGVIFNVLNNSFTCPVSKVLKNCDDPTELFTCASLLYNGSQLAIGTYFSANINGRNLCLQYIADTTNTASNSNVFVIYNIFQDCSYCVQISTPTPTSTVTPTITPTTTITPTITPTNTVTPTVTKTPGLTQSPTPSITPTITPTISLTPTNTPTVSPTPNYVYVFRSCFQDLNGITQEIIQTSPLPFTVNTNELIRSNLSAPNECWTYKGRFNSNYLPPPNTQPTTFNGNYFAGINQITYSSCTDCFNSGCVRPPELIPIILNSYFDDDRVSPRRTYNFNSFAEACFYLNEFFSPSCISSSLCGIGGATGYVVSLTVGSYVYGNSGCNYFPDGIYITDLGQGIVVEIINGQINSIQTCP